jgi:chaperonin GroES
MKQSLELVARVEDVELLHDNVLLRRCETLARASGIVVVNEEKPVEADVIAVGTKVRDVKKGDRVIFARFKPTKVTIVSEELLICKEEDCLAIVTRS